MDFQLNIWAFLFALNRLICLITSSVTETTNVGLMSLAQMEGRSSLTLTGTAYKVNVGNVYEGSSWGPEFSEK